MKFPIHRRASSLAVGADANQLETAQRRLRHARKRARLAQRKLVAMKERLSKVNSELAQLRAFTLEVFPGIPVPEDVVAVQAAVRAEHLTYLAEEQLGSLVGCVLEVEASNRAGMIVEAGTARGGSAIAMAAAKSPEREMRVYDVFGMIPPPTEKDGAKVLERFADIEAGRSTGPGGEAYYGYRDDLLGEVTESFSRHGVPVDRHNVALVQGLFQDTLTIEGPVALAHVDGDWYESTMTCLERIAPRLVPGGRIVIDDYFMWSGCRAAVNEYFANRSGYRIEKRAKVHIVRL